MRRLGKIEYMTHASLGAAQVHGGRPAGAVDEGAGRLYDIDDCSSNILAGDEASNTANKLDCVHWSVLLSA